MFTETAPKSQTWVPSDMSVPEEYGGLSLGLDDNATREL